MDIIDELRAWPARGDGSDGMSAHTVGEMMNAAADEIERLRHPFRCADHLDWDHLFKMIPDSGHGKFWKTVMSEMRTALGRK
jgi:hypothetical protein